MVLHTCNKCKKEFSRKDAYTVHLARKKPCINIIYENDMQLNHTDIKQMLHSQAEQIQHLTEKIDQLTDFIKLKISDTITHV